MAVSIAKRIEEFKKTMPPAETIANMERDDMIKARLWVTKQKKPKELVDTVQKFFGSNNAMPGEGALKAVSSCLADKDHPELAESVYLAMGNGDAVTGKLKTEKKMARDYAVTCIKQFRPHNVDFDAIDAKAYSRKELGPGMSRIMCTAQAGKIMTADPEPADRKVVADIDEKFLANHRATDGMPVSLVTVDNGNGRDGMLVRAIIDLGAEPLDLQLEYKWRQLDHGQEPDYPDDRDPKKPDPPKIPLPDPDDFTEAVNNLPVPDGGLYI